MSSGIDTRRYTGFNQNVYSFLGAINGVHVLGEILFFPYFASDNRIRFEWLKKRYLVIDSAT